MNAEQFRKAIARLGLSQNAAAKLVGADPRTARRWAADTPIPKSVAILLWLLLAKKITIEDIGKVSNGPRRH